MKGIIGADIFVNLLLVFIIVSGLLFMNTNRPDTPSNVVKEERTHPKVDLQEGQSPSSKEAKEAVIISTIKDAKGLHYYVDGAPVSFDQLPAKLGPGRNRVVKIRFDKNIEYGKYVEILDLCRRNGFTEIINTYAFEKKDGTAK
jgi:biopolymer transport protein ExbD